MQAGTASQLQLRAPAMLSQHRRGAARLRFSIRRHLEGYVAKQNFGLTNFYLKTGVALLLLGPALVVASLLTHSSNIGDVLMHSGGGLFISGAVVYIPGRISKALRSIST